MKMKNAETIKYKKRTSTQKELLNLFNDLLKTILVDEMLMSSKDDVNENENENGNENENDSENENENENDNKIKKLNNSLDKIIDKSKSIEDQIKLFKKVKYLIDYCHESDYGNKELNLKSLN